MADEQRNKKDVRRPSHLQLKCELLFPGPFRKIFAFALAHTLITLVLYCCHSEIHITRHDDDGRDLVNFFAAKNEKSREPSQNHYVALVRGENRTCVVMGYISLECSLYSYFTCYFLGSLLLYYSTTNAALGHIAHIASAWPGQPDE